MININDSNEINKYLRQVLITQSELSPERVLDALSVYGTELDKLLDESIYNSIDRTNATMLFELNTRTASSDMTMEENEVKVEALTCSNYVFCDDLKVSNDLKVLDSDITSYKAFRLNVIIYGDASTNIAQKLVARLNSEACRVQLYEQGIYLEKLSDPNTINEFKNDTMWLRTDINIDIAIKQNITQITLDNDYNIIDDVNIIKNK